MYEKEHVKFSIQLLIDRKVKKVVQYLQTTTATPFHGDPIMTSRAFTRKRTCASVALVASMTLINACSDETTVPRTMASLQYTVLPGSERHLIWDTPSDEMARQIPRFGGAYVANGDLNVSIVGNPLSGEEEGDARGVITRLFDAHGRQEMPVRFVGADYSFIEMRTWEATLRQYYNEFGIVMAGVDERTNRLVLRVLSEEYRAAFLARAHELAIPTEGLTITVGPAGFLTATLDDKLWPLRGGIRIATRYNPSASPADCTLGPMVQPQGSSFRYAVTNAHCVQAFPGTFGGVTGGTVNQPVEAPLSVNWIGDVVVNPAAVGGIPGCGGGHVCRYSDAALIELIVGAALWDFGYLARPAGRGVGPSSSSTITIDSVNPRISLFGTSNFILAGDSLEKIGHNTGWTAGVLSQVCTYIYEPGDNGGRMCTGVVEAGVIGGDSGSPVFWRDGLGRYRIVGLLWGGEPALGVRPRFYFSRWSNVQSELTPGQNLNVK